MEFSGSEAGYRKEKEGWGLHTRWNQ